MSTLSQTNLSGIVHLFKTLNLIEISRQITFASLSTTALPAFASGFLLGLLGCTIELNGHWMHKDNTPIGSSHPMHSSALQ